MTNSEPLAVTLSSYEAGASQYADNSQDRTPLTHLHERFASLVGNRGQVMDLGCGPGHDAAVLASSGLTAVAMDPARGLLLEGGTYRTLHGRRIQGEARALPFGDSAFDGVWACASLLHLAKADVPIALSEVHRVLRPGAIFFTSMQHGAGELVPFDPGSGLQPRYYFFYLEQEWETVLLEAGFEIIAQVVNYTDQGVTAHADGWIETFARRR